MAETAETADPGEQELEAEAPPGGAKDERLVIAEEVEAKVDVEP